MFQVASSLCPHHAHKSFYFALLWHSYSLQFFNCKSTLCYTEAKLATQIARRTIVFHFLLPIFFFFLKANTSNPLPDYFYHVYFLVVGAAADC